VSRRFWLRDEEPLPHLLHDLDHGCLLLRVAVNLEADDERQIRDCKGALPNRDAHISEGDLFGQGIAVQHPRLDHGHLGLIHRLDLAVVLCI